MDTLTHLERAVLDKLLAGDQPVLSVLRHQAANVEVVCRKFTGAGFTASLRVAGDVPRAPLTRGRIAFGDVTASIQGLKHGAGFVLFIRDGYVDLLEGYSYDEPWPADTDSFSLSYAGGTSRDLSRLGPVND